MLLHHSIIRASILALFFANVAISGHGFQTARQVSAASIAGTWTGKSICVGSRPACKNEVVVYRFEPVAGKSTVVTLLADKLINGKRVPMYKLDFQYDEATRTLSCDFNQGRTRGTWEYKISGDTMEGTGIVLAGRSVARRVKVKRVSEDQVPAAPHRESYGYE